VPVQDDERERELVRLFNLRWDPAHQRGGVDAALQIELNGKSFEIEVEVKSSTGQSVSTARDVGMAHIQKWRTKLFVIGFYSKVQSRPELQRCLCLTPDDMEPWVASIEEKILTDFKLATRSSQRLDLEDLFEVCGEQANYSVKDARRLHKLQWTAAQYAAAQDIAVGKTRRISQQKMLELLRLRARYIAEGGATLNNPHVTKKHLSQFSGTDREVLTDWASRIRTIATEFVKKNPSHPSIAHRD
jgi:hypothetical protein